MIIAFQGTKGAYSEEAIHAYMRSLGIQTSSSYSAQGYTLGAEVCEAVESKSADYGMLPVENSIVGSVGAHVDLFFHHNIFAIGEVYLPIHHHLLALPGTTLNDIKEVYSHPVALDQCREFFQRHKITAIPAYDTAGAAKLLKEQNIKHAGTIASVLCAQYYGLEVVTDQVQNIANNFTRFLFFKRLIEKKSDSELFQGNKTSLAFKTKHHPGALLNCLQAFASASINLTKLESRPVPQDPFSYVFYVDFLGNPVDQKVQQCLSQLEQDAQSIKVLGVYVDRHTTDINRK